MAIDFEEVPLDEIEIPKERIRKDAGDISSLAASITQLGQLQPVVLTRDKQLVCGYRRLKALEAASIEVALCVFVDDLADAHKQLVAERDENIERLDFTPEEKVMLARRLEALEKPKAAKRKKATQAKKGNKKASKNGHGNGGGKLPPPKEQNGKTRDKVAEAVGMSGKTYTKAKAVVEAAESGDEVAQKALVTMNKTGNVSAAHRKVTKANKKSDPKPFDRPDATERVRKFFDRELEKWPEAERAVFLHLWKQLVKEVE